jgi:hypothetical protein
MVAMNPRLVVLLLCASLLLVAQAKATILPDSCGPDQVKFKMEQVGSVSEGHDPTPTPPATGMAKIIFIEVSENPGAYNFTTPTTRFGVDGKWVGANKGNSYFTVEVAPGAHHLCVNWQSDNDKEANKIAMKSFTAEGGKIYYYEIHITRNKISGTHIYGGGPGASVHGGGGGHTDITFEFTQVDDDEGGFRLKSSPPSKFSIIKAE